MSGRPQADSACPRPPTEVLLVSLVAGLIREGSLPSGAIVDAGAYTADFACFFAELDPKRLVHAVEPSLGNFRTMNRFATSIPNLVPLHGGLGSHSAFLPAPQRVSTTFSMKEVAASKAHASNGATFEVFVLDELARSRWAGQTLALLHLDVQGFELEVVRGATATLRRDQPLVTTEVEVHKDAAYTASLLREMRQLGYASFVIEELCGWPRADCRNLLHVPHSRSAALARSPTLDLLSAAQKLFRVDEHSIATHAYPRGTGSKRPRPTPRAPNAKVAAPICGPILPVVCDTQVLRASRRVLSRRRQVLLPAAGVAMGHPRHARVPACRPQQHGDARPAAVLARAVCPGAHLSLSRQRGRPAAARGRAAGAGGWCGLGGLVIISLADLTPFVYGLLHE